MAELRIRIEDERGRVKTAKGFFSGVIEKLPDELSEFHAEESKKFLKVAQKEDGFTKDPVVIVDKKTNVSIKEVKPFGTILYIDPTLALGQFFINAYDAIVKVSPDGPSIKNKGKQNKYINNNWVYFNNGNTPVARDRLSFRTWLERKELKAGDVVSFVNAVPYARRLEYLSIKGGNRPSVGTGGESFYKKKGSFLVRTPNGAYIAAQRTISKIFQGFATVPSVQFVPRLINIAGFTSNSFQTKGKGFGRPYLYPQIDVRIQAGQGGFGNVQ